METKRPLELAIEALTIRMHNELRTAEAYERGNIRVHTTPKAAADCRTHAERYARAIAILESL